MLDSGINIKLYEFLAELLYVSRLSGARDDVDAWWDHTMLPLFGNDMARVKAFKQQPFFIKVLDDHAVWYQRAQVPVELVQPLRAAIEDRNVAATLEALAEMRPWLCYPCSEARAQLLASPEAAEASHALEAELQEALGPAAQRLLDDRSVPVPAMPDGLVEFHPGTGGVMGAAWNGRTLDVFKADPNVRYLVHAARRAAHMMVAAPGCGTRAQLARAIAAVGNTMEIPGLAGDGISIHRWIDANGAGTPARGPLTLSVGAMAMRELHEGGGGEVLAQLSRARQCMVAAAYAGDWRDLSIRAAVGMAGRRFTDIQGAGARCGSMTLDCDPSILNSLYHKDRLRDTPVGPLTSALANLAWKQETGGEAAGVTKALCDVAVRSKEKRMFPLVRRAAVAAAGGNYWRELHIVGEEQGLRALTGPSTDGSFFLDPLRAAPLGPLSAALTTLVLRRDTDGREADACASFRRVRAQVERGQNLMRCRPMLLRFVADLAGLRPGGRSAEDLRKWREVSRLLPALGTPTALLQAARKDLPASVGPMGYGCCLLALRELAGSDEQVQAVIAALRRLRRAQPT